MLNGSTPYCLKALYLALILSFCLILGSCATSVVGGQSKVLTQFNESLLDKGQGAIMMHAINRGGLIATRWFKIVDPDQKQSFTVYRSNRHRALDQMDIYDVVTVEPGTYVLYSIFGNCDEGLRPNSTDWDEPLRPEVATSLGMVSWLRSWKPGGGLSSDLGVGIWGGNEGGFGANFGLGMGTTGMASGPGTPTATCNLISRGFVNGRPALATVTVKAGEVVYAGELHLEYGSNNNCIESGNWLTENQTRKYCGADWVNLRVTDAFSTKALPFIEKHLGPQATQRAVVRLAEPGSQVSVK